MTTKWEIKAKAPNTRSTQMEERAASKSKPSTKVLNFLDLVRF
jgi:hypothetical protein